MKDFCLNIFYTYLHSDKLNLSTIKQLSYFAEVVSHMVLEILIANIKNKRLVNGNGFEINIRLLSLKKFHYIFVP